MSKPTNPMTIGIFVIGSLAFLLLGLFTFGGKDLFNRDQIKYVIFFDSSLNGLELGAPVKMQGVKIGSVSEIALQLDPNTGKVYKPVVIEIDRTSFIGPSGQALPQALSEKQARKNRDQLVAAGFRARLEMQSLLTGLLYVDLDIHPYRPVQYVGLDYQGLLEIPSIPTATDEIRNTLDEVMSGVRQLPLKDIVNDLSETLREVRKLLGSEEVRRSREAMAKSLEEAAETMTKLNRELGPLLDHTHKTLGQTQLMMQESQALVRDFRNETKPLLVATQQAIDSATMALTQAKSTLTAMEDSLGSESTLRETLLSLRDAARSINHLTDYLERHPEALFSGKY
jgi:paraquat-inducible protein B